MEIILSYSYASAGGRKCIRKAKPFWPDELTFLWKKIAVKNVNGSDVSHIETKTRKTVS